MSIRLPIRIRQLPRLAASLAARARLRPMARSGPTTFRLCYFTCGSYFRYLYCSIHSLTLIGTPHALEIVIFCDRDQMFSPEQVAALTRLGLSMRIIPWPKAQGWGVDQIARIWEAYALVASDAPTGAYVARVDSDVFFFSGWLFDAVAKSRMDLVGDGHFVDFEYCQGGAYFLRAEKVSRILATTPIAEFGRELRQARIGVEDIATHFLARKAGLRIWLLFFMMFADEYANAGRLTRYQRLKFACLHYSKKDKAPMIDVYLDQVIRIDERTRFIAALET